jgi:hypothetical protein
LGAVIGQFIADCIQVSRASREKAAQKRAQEKALSDARTAERESRERLQRWREFTEQQKARGKAGDASQDTAREALRGNGGRRSPLDDRWF